MKILNHSRPKTLSEINADYAHLVSMGMDSDRAMQLASMPTPPVTKEDINDDRYDDNKSDWEDQRK